MSLDDVSVIIPVRDDPLIFRCLESIGPDIRVVIVANGSPAPFLRKLRDIAHDPVRLVVLEQPGIGAAYNAGIAASTTRWVLLMDSDCTFRPGGMAAMTRHATGSRLVKGRVEFEYDTWQTRLSALGRRYLEDPRFTGRVNAYSPPLMYPKDLIQQMGGHHFDDRLKWREDRDFELRRRAAGLPVHFEPEATIVHKKLSIRDDLTSVRNYGRAQRVGESSGALPRLRFGHEVRKVTRMWRRVLRQGGLAVSTYAVSRYLVLWGARAFSREAAR